jgi:hypothetical protein
MFLKWTSNKCIWCLHVFGGILSLNMNKIITLFQLAWKCILVSNIHIGFLSKMKKNQWRKPFDIGQGVTQKRGTWLKATILKEIHHMNNNSYKMTNFIRCMHQVANV